MDAGTLKSDQKERLNNKEFLELMPFLPLEELLMVQTNLKGRWIHIFSFTILRTQMPKSILCTICNEKLPIAEFKRHIKTETHQTKLGLDQQFYHPLYTYSKESTDLANGKKVSSKELGEAIDLAIKCQSKPPRYKFLQAQSVASLIEKVEKEVRLKETDDGDENKELFEKAIENIALITNTDRPGNVYVTVSLPIKDLLQIEFCAVKEWEFMLTSKTPYTNGKYFCCLCSIHCAGIITVNAHLRGFQHMTRQLATKGVRVNSYPQLTKNCCYKYDEEFKMYVKEAGIEYFSSQAMDIVRTTKKELKQDTNQKSMKKNKGEVDELPELNPEIAKKAKILQEMQEQKKTLSSNISCLVDEEGLVGVEYVLKIMKHKNDTHPRYECCLCKHVCDESLMQAHLISFKHRIKYCETHYLDTVKKYEGIIGHMKYIDFIRVMSQVLAKVTKAIEQHHGRGELHVIVGAKSDKSRHDTITKIYDMPHACQEHGPSFSNTVSKKDIEHFKSDIYYEPPIVTSDTANRFTLASKETVYPAKRPNWKSEGSNLRGRRSKSPLEKPSRKRARSPSPHSSGRDYARKRKETSERRKSIPVIWKIYREEVSLAASEIERSYMEYRKNPESHPLYDKEWNSFWQRRKESLVADGINHRTHNFQPEWVRYFRARLEELFGEALQESTVNVRKRLSIPLDAEEDSQPTLEKPIVQKQDSSFADALQFEPQHSSIIEPIYNAISSINKKISTWNQYQQSTNESKTIENIPAPRKDDKPSIIHVLRLLTALEEHLGSLGSKVMELLSNTLVIEKNCHGDFDLLERKVLTSNNCTLLETAMEKLKGILFAGLLENSKINAFKSVIQATEDMLKHAGKMGYRISPCDFAEKTITSNDLQKLFDEMQTKRADFPSASQKSLSDTLMELISERKDSSNHYNSSQNGNNMPFVQTNTMSSNKHQHHSFNTDSQRAFYDQSHLNTNITKQDLNSYKRVNSSNSIAGKVQNDTAYNKNWTNAGGNSTAIQNSLNFSNNSNNASSANAVQQFTAPFKSNATHLGIQTPNMNSNNFSRNSFVAGNNQLWGRFHNQNQRSSQQTQLFPMRR